MVDEEAVRVEVPVPPAVSVMLVGLSARVRPAGVLDFVSVTVPAKLPRLFSVMVEFAELPNGKARLEGLAVMVKSGLCALKNSVMAVAPASLLVIVARLQFVSIVLVNE